MTRSRARRALAPEPAAKDNKAPPQDPPSPSPAPKDVVQAQKKDPVPFKYLALPQRVRALVNGFVDERPLLFSPPSPTLLALSETCRLAHTETRSLVWSTVVYKPSDLIAASGDPLKRDLKELKKIDQHAPLLVQRLAVDGLAPGHLSRLGAAAAADYGLKEASRAIKLLKNFASHSLRKLRLSDFTVSCRDAERLVAQIAISSVDTLVMRHVRASCAEDGASTHRFPLHSPAPRLKHLEIIDGPDCFVRSLTFSPRGDDHEEPQLTNAALSPAARPRRPGFEPREPHGRLDRLPDRRQARRLHHQGARLARLPVDRERGCGLRRLRAVQGPVGASDSLFCIRADCLELKLTHGPSPAAHHGRRSVERRLPAPGAPRQELDGIARPQQRRARAAAPSVARASLAPRLRTLLGRVRRRARPVCAGPQSALARQRRRLELEQLARRHGALASCTLTLDFVGLS